MKVYLFYPDKILTYLIPKKVSGSFSFDENPEETSKLINIEARENVWMIYSTADSNVMLNGAPTYETPLLPDTYYTIQRSGKDYLIYVTESFDADLDTYSYDENINLIIGNDDSCNVRFPNNLINGTVAKISYKEKKLLIEVTKQNVYKNDIMIMEPLTEIHMGDTINIYGLRITFFYQIILINNPMKSLQINMQTTKILPKRLAVDEKPKDIQVKDVDLYTKDDYYSKSPRLRRKISTKEIVLNAPPKNDSPEELPLILTLGPAITMAITSGVMFLNNVLKIMNGTTTFGKSWPQLLTSIAMLTSSLVWPNLTKKFNKKLKARKEKITLEKYTKYLESKRKELTDERNLQKEILIENLITTKECLELIANAKINFWDKRIEQSDFLDVRIGTGNVKLDVNINYPEEGFTIEEDNLRQAADKLVEEFKYINDVPMAYSFYKNKITAIMGTQDNNFTFVDNVLLQLLTFYSYEDIKIAVFTDERHKKHWDYLKYINHSFSNDRSIRFFASDQESSKNLADYLGQELQGRIQAAQDGSPQLKPYYIIIIDDYELVKRHGFMKVITEVDENLGFSLIILENQMSKLPSKCNNFISIGKNQSEVLTNAFEEQERQTFKNEFDQSVDMMEIARKLSNIPIEFQEGNKQLPDSITFLEMEKAGKVEQLNILNRWDLNDSTQSLKAEVGVDEEGNLMYLDLHEKHHGPHGLIAGMTGSGKSEFIITYILSMAVNYSPDDVAFILIDYKGGGLAFAFENKSTGMCLPHLAGTITNLDKAEMNRTLVSIDSEIKRRQKVFNEARDMLGESTIDIYKYQRWYKEGKIKTPVPHLFIICDEFAELKSQQPEFMDNLISVARIGRSLGVHLILATQKPSGVVNDQIWSNTKFRVCLKVQDESDSKEMLKRPEAASIKQTGRFYLQVGFDEYFALGQSAWCGAKYFPSERIIKQVDKSINFIDDTGNFVKSMQAGNNIKIEAQGEQLSAILKNIISVAKMTDKKAMRLWLNDIDPIILIDNLRTKYNFQITPYDLKAIVGEYDAPERQEQGILTYYPKEQGNLAIFGNDEQEREKLIHAIIYSLCEVFSPDELNLYGIDYGSESLRMFSIFPQVGGVVYPGEEEKFKNVLKLITEELKNRKKLLNDYGGSMEAYNEKNEKKLPQILFFINNYDSITEEYETAYEEFSSIGRDCERYGIYLILTTNTPGSLGRRMSQCFASKFALHLTDASDYYGVFPEKTKNKPKDVLGRGLASDSGVHEFQTASIVEEDQNLNEKIQELGKSWKAKTTSQAPVIPSLPEQITLDIIANEITSFDKVPIGISRSSLEIEKFDFMAYPETSIASNKLEYINEFADSLIEVFLRIKGLTVIFIDPSNMLPKIKEKEVLGHKVNYFDQNISAVINQLKDFENKPENSEFKVAYIFYGIEKIKSKLDDIKVLDEFFKSIKKSDNHRLIICDSNKSLKALDYETWYSQIKNPTDGIWIGKGFSEQSVFKISKITKEMMKKYSNNYGYVVKESSGELIKLLEFDRILKQEDEEDEE